MIVIGNPENRRTASLQRARERVGLPPAVVVPYLDLLRNHISLTEAAEQGGMLDGIPPLLRLDAPGENFDVERELIALGAPDAARDEGDDRLLPFGGRDDPQPMSVRAASALMEQRGRLYHPSQWFRGYGRLLARLEREAGAIWPTAGWLNAPRDIAGMFDKRSTHNVLKAAGVSVPRRLASPEALPDYDALYDTMRDARLHRIFLKLAVGSGACGVVAYQINPHSGAELATTTLAFDSFISKPPQFYNVLKLRRYTDRAVIRPIVNWLLKHGAHAEQWVAKAAYGDRTFDIRQLVVGGEACHSIARVSRTPITNLHLRSERMSMEELSLPQLVQENMRKCAEAALAAYPSSSVAGIDVLIGKDLRQPPSVVDVNPFGDLLYNVAYQGMDAYEWQMRRLGSGRRDIAR
ncbi:STM4014 family protein [Paenibacillus oenotherae]